MREGANMWGNEYMRGFMKRIFRPVSVYVILGNIEEHIGLLMALEKKNLLKSGKFFYDSEY